MYTYITFLCLRWCVQEIISPGDGTNFPKVRFIDINFGYTIRMDPGEILAKRHSIFHHHHHKNRQEIS